MDGDSYLKIRQLITNLDAKGEPVNPEAFLAYLELLESEDGRQQELRLMTHQSNLAHYEGKHRSRLAGFTAKLDTRKAMFDSIIEAGRAALKSSILINGGASIAILSLMGNMSTKGSFTVPSELKSSLASFAAGVLVGALATATTYLTQYYYEERSTQKTGASWHKGTVYLVVATYIFFGLGVWFAYQSF